MTDIGRSSSSWTQRGVLKALLLLSCALPHLHGQTVVNSSFSAGESTTISGPNTVDTAGTVVVPASANVVFVGATRVTLSDGFRVENDAVFRANNGTNASGNRLTPVNAGGAVGSGFSYRINAPEATTYGATGLPPGLSVNPTTGEIYGTPTEAGTYTVTLTAIFDTGTETATATFTITGGALPLVGQFPVEVSVDNKGAANTVIPLALPAGRAGLEPKLALQYSSQGGNGPLGIGYSLSTGYPHAITRGRSILARDGVVEGVKFETSDKLYLDGKRLICVSGPYGQPTSVYRTEVDSFVTITACGSGSQIDGFRMQTKDGMLLAFGKNVTDANGASIYSETDGYHVPAAEPQNKALSWALKWVEDSVGNYLEFRYDETDVNGDGSADFTLAEGEHVLTSVRYTGNRATPKVPRYITWLRYNSPGNISGFGPTMARPDGNRTYDAGRYTSMSARLDEVAVAESPAGLGSPIRSYRLKYDSAVLTPTLLRLASVERKDAGVVGATTLGVQSRWGAPTTALDLPNLPPFDWAETDEHQNLNPLISNPKFVGDFNGDGRTDVLFYRRNRIIYGWRGSDGSWQHNDPSTVTPPGNGILDLVTTGDFNGDGRTDLVWMVTAAGANDGWYLTLSNGSGFTPLIKIAPKGDSLHNKLTKNSAQAVDLDGDGCDELMFQVREKVIDWGYQWVDEDGTPAVGGDAVSESTTVVLPNGPLHIVRPKFSGNTLISAPEIELTSLSGLSMAISLRRTDLNGDGRSDFIATAVSTSPVNPNATIDWGVWTYRNVGNDTFVRGPLYLAGDSGWLNPGEDSAGHLALGGDVNGDGLEDFIYIFHHAASENVSNLGWRVALSKGDGTFEEGVYAGIPEQIEIDGAARKTFIQRTGDLQIKNNDAESDGPPYFINEMHGFDLCGVTLLDWNGDGRKDFVFYADGLGWRCFLAGPSGFDLSKAIPIFGSAVDSINYYSQTSDPTIHEFNFDAVASDIEGTGRESLLLFERGWPYYQFAFDVTYALNRAADSYRVVGITDGLGAQTSIQYAPISDDNVYSAGAAVNYPIRETRHATVVSDLYRDSGGNFNAGDRQHFSYQYSGSRTDLSGRGFLGFHSFVTLDEQTRVFKYQFLTQSFPMTGLAARDQTYRYWTSNNTANFRLISSHDNTVVFDEVVKGPSDSTPWGSVYPFVSKAIESRWEDATTAHFTDDIGGASAKPELLFPKELPANAHITITAKSWFDEQSLEEEPLLSNPGAYKPSDTGTSGANVVVGTADYTTFHGLSFDHKITYGNLRKLETDYGDGFKETVVNEYKSPVGVLTGLVDNTKTTVVSPNYGTETAPTKRYTYWGNTPLVETDKIDATGDKLDLTTTYDRDDQGRVTKTSIAGYDNASDDQHIGSYAASTVTAFDSRFDLPTTTKNAEPYLHTSTVVYDPVLGLPTSVKDVNDAETTTSYDALGRPLKVTDVLKGLATRSDYRWTSVAASDWTRTQTVSPPAGHTGVAAGAPVSGVTGVTLSSSFVVMATETGSTSTTAFKPTVWTYYDRLGRAIRTIKENFTGKTITDTAYNNLGQVIAVSLPYPENGTVYWTKTAYDAFGRVATVTAPNGTVTTTSYHGRATVVSVDAPNLGGADPAAQVNATLVDAKGRTIKVWNPDPDTGAGPTFSDTLGTTTTTPSLEFDLDGFGRMRATTLKGQTAKVTAAYDELGRQTSLNDPDKGNWSYVNNALGQIVKQTDARNNVTKSTFDRLGRALSRTTTEPNTGPIETANWFYYDATANTDLHLIEKGTQGWIGAQQRQETSTSGSPGYAATNSVATTAHYFDDKGRPSIDVTTVDGNWFYTWTEYDTYSRTSSLRYYWRKAGVETPPQTAQDWEEFGLSYAYDAKSYLLSIKDTTPALRTWWEVHPTEGYDHLDRPVLVRKGSSHWTKRTYRAEDGVLSAIKTGLSVGSTSIQNLGFTFDGLGNLRERTGPGGTETLTYDSLNRLTLSSKQGAASYEENGNIKNKIGVGGATTSDYTYDATHPHAVHTAFGYTMGYDASGNLSSRTKDSESWGFRYAGFDKPRWMTKTVGGTTVGSEFLYDANRSRTVQLEYDQVDGNGAPSHYVRKRVYGLGPTLEVNYDNTAASGSPTWTMKKVRIYMPGPDGAIGAREFDLPGGTEKPLVYHYDHLGSIDAITLFGSTDTGLAATDGGKTGRYSEAAWGERRNPNTWSGAPTDTDGGGATSLTPRGFTGHEMLDDLGLVHMNGRIYDGLLGRFLTADIFVQNPADIQAYNRYSYVWNNPLSRTDPSGWWNIWNPLTYGLPSQAGENPWSIKDSSAEWGATVRGADGGAQIYANSLSMGATDALGVTNAASLANDSAYNGSRIAGGVGSAALMIATGGAATEGSAAARVIFAGMAAKTAADGAEQAGAGAAQIATDPKSAQGYVNVVLGTANMVGSVAGAKGIGNATAGVNSAAPKTGGVPEVNPSTAPTTEGAACFTAGTEIRTAGEFVPIETVRVGDRVLTGSDSTETKVDPQTWRLVTLRINGVSEDVFEIVCLKPLAWLQENRVTPGSRVHFAVDEMGIDGEAAVINVVACPTIATGAGRVVLMAVTHFNPTVVELTLVGLKKTLEPTAAHRLFSASRNDWVQAQELQVGEYLKTANGTVEITAIARKPGVHRVYNIEVETEHRYLVSKLQVFSHNACSVQTTKAGGKLTEPQLPAKTIVSENGVTVEHYYRSGDHGPAHLHVSGEGAATKIGQAGKPIKGSPELSAAQKAVVGDNKSSIRKAVDKIQRWFKYQNE